MVAIKLIGDSFYFHVAYLVQREPEMVRLAQYFTLKGCLNNNLGKLENV
jgi:hypothetical protein